MVNRKTVLRKENSRPIFKLKTMPIEPTLEDYTQTLRDLSAKETKES